MFSVIRQKKTLQQIYGILILLIRRIGVHWESINVNIGLISQN